LRGGEIKSEKKKLNSKGSRGERSLNVQNDINALAGVVPSPPTIYLEKQKKREGYENELRRLRGEVGDGGNRHPRSVAQSPRGRKAIPMLGNLLREGSRKKRKKKITKVLGEMSQGERGICRGQRDFSAIQCESWGSGESPERNNSRKGEMSGKE